MDTGTQKRDALREAIVEKAAKDGGISVKDVNTYILLGLTKEVSEDDKFERHFDKHALNFFHDKSSISISNFVEREYESKVRSKYGFVDDEDDDYFAQINVKDIKEQDRLIVKGIQDVFDNLGERAAKYKMKYGVVKRVPIKRYDEETEKALREEKEYQQWKAKHEWTSRIIEEAAEEAGISQMDVSDYIFKEMRKRVRGDDEYKKYFDRWVHLFFLDPKYIDVIDYVKKEYTNHGSYEDRIMYRTFEYYFEHIGVTDEDEKRELVLKGMQDVIDNLGKKAAEYKLTREVE